MVWIWNVTIFPRTLDDKKVLVCEDDTGAEGQNESSADHPLASLSSLSTNSTCFLLSIGLLSALSLSLH